MTSVDKHDVSWHTNMTSVNRQTTYFYIYIDLFICLFAIIFFQGTSYGRGRCIYFREGSLDWKSEVLVLFLRIKSDRMAITPSPALSPSNTSDKIFEMTILLKIVQRSFLKKTLGSTHTPPGPGGRLSKFCPGGIYGSYRRDTHINLREGSFDWKLKVLVRFLRIKRDQEVISPSPTPFFHKSIRYKFWDRHFLKNSSNIR